MTDLDQVDGTLGHAIASADELATCPCLSGDPVLRLKLADIAYALAHSELALLEAKDELTLREREIQKLRQAFARHEATVDHHGMRYRLAAGGRPCGRPFCQRCDEVEGRLILTQQLTGDCNEVFCPACKTRYPHVPTFLEEDEMGTEAEPPRNAMKA